MVLAALSSSSCDLFAVRSAPTCTTVPPSRMSKCCQYALAAADIGSSALSSASLPRSCGRSTVEMKNSPSVSCCSEPSNSHASRNDTYGAIAATYKRRSTRPGSASGVVCVERQSVSALPPNKRPASERGSNARLREKGFKPGMLRLPGGGFRARVGRAGLARLCLAEDGSPSQRPHRSRAGPGVVGVGNGSSKKSTRPESDAAKRAAAAAAAPPAPQTRPTTNKRHQHQHQHQHKNATPTQKEKATAATPNKNSTEERQARSTTRGRTKRARKQARGSHLQSRAEDVLEREEREPALTAIREHEGRLVAACRGVQDTADASIRRDIVRQHQERRPESMKEADRQKQRRRGIQYQGGAAR
eukprot:1360117-Rhodomonas_salina.1